MKYIEKRKSRIDPQVPVYVFSVGIEEVKLLHALAKSARQYTPDIFETTMVRGRLREFCKTLAEMMRSQKEPFRP